MRRLVAPVLVAGALAGVAAPGASIPTAASERPSVSVRVHGNYILYAVATTDPYADVVATVASELVRADGTRHQGFGVLHDFPTRFDDAWTAVEVWFGDYHTRIVPGDVIALSSPWHPQRIIPVPPLAVDVDPATSSILGRVVPGAELRLAFAVCSTSWRCRDVDLAVVGDGQGGFEVPLAPWLDGAALGTLEGTATLRADADTEFIATFARTSATIEVGSIEVAGTATAGASITMTALTTDVTVGRGQQRVGDMEGSSRWSRSLGWDKPLRTRSRLALDYVHPVTRQAYTMTLAPADLAVDVDRIKGTARVPAALAGAAIRVVGRSPLSGRRVLVSPTDGQGGAAYDVSEVVPAGGPAVLHHEVVSDGVITRRTAYLPGLRFLLGSGRVSGVLEESAGTTIAVTNRSSQTTLDPVMLGASGRFLSRTFDGLSFEPGDQVRLDSGDGDPTVVVLPSLSAAYRLPDHALHGVVRPGTHVLVTVRGGRLDAPLLIPVVGDAAGRFVVPLAEHVERGRPLSGMAEVGIAQHHSGYVVWSQPWITYDLGGSFVDLVLPTGREHTIAVSGRDPEVVSTVTRSGTAEEDLAGSPASAQRVRLLGGWPDRDWFRPGDRITVTSREGFHAWRVPSVEWHVQGSRAVVTTTMSLEAAQLCVEGAASVGARCVEAALGADGTAVADFGQPLSATSRLRAELSGIDQKVRAWHRAPTLEADVDLGTVLVTGLPDAAGGYALAVRRDGATAFARDLIRVADGMTATIQGGLRPGDELVVGTTEGSVVLAVVVPEVRVETVAAPRVTGFAQQPDVAHVSLSAGRVLETVPSLSRAALGQALAVPDAEGRFEALPSPERDLTFASALALRSVTRAGHTFVQRHMTPALYVASRSREICGYTGVPYADVEVLRAASGPVSRDAVQSDRLGGFRLAIAADAPITAGNRITMTAGAIQLTHEVPAVRVEREVADRWGPEYYALVGSGPPATRYHYLDEDLCARIEPRLAWAAEQATRADGRFDERDTSIAMGAERTLAFDTAYPGVFALRPYVWWGLRVFPERRRIELLMSRWNTAKVGIVRREGDPLAETTLRTLDEPFVAYEAPIEDPFAPGDTIAIAVDHRSTTMTLPHLEIDWSPGDGIVGSSDDPAHTTVALGFEGGGNESLAPQRLSGTRFAVAAETIAALEAARGERVVGVRATLHHSPVLDVVVESADAPARPGTTRAYLPFAYHR